MAASMWRSIPCRISELRLDKTLVCGQSFRWKETDCGEWTGVIDGLVWTLKQTETELMYLLHQNIEGKSVDSMTQKNRKWIRNRFGSGKTIISKNENQISIESFNSELNSVIEEEDILRDYFQLSIDVGNLYSKWGAADPNFDKISQTFAGVRILRQDPVECLFSFICSSNNNISRISSMVEKLCIHYGEKITEVKGQPYHAFPSVSALAGDDTESKLRELGFGYRAKYISQSAKYIEGTNGEDWLYQLRGQDYKVAKQELTKLCGVGAKVADCVCLFSMDKPGAIPVDTHVWQIAARDYMPKLKQAKSLTDKLYGEIGDHFRSLWGDYAGWAHSVLFTADLKQFKDKQTNSPPKKSKKRGAKEKEETFTTKKKNKR